MVLKDKEKPRNYSILKDTKDVTTKFNSQSGSGFYSRKKKCSKNNLGQLHNLNMDIKLANVCMLVAQSCSILCDPIDYSSPGFSVHGSLQARILEWVAILFSRGSSRPKD